MNAQFVHGDGPFSEIIAALKPVAADAKRLDWLAGRGDPRLCADFETGFWGILEYQGNINDRVPVWLTRKEHETLRGAIDAAMINTSPEN